jgi:hypothetical protein
MKVFALAALVIVSSALACSQDGSTGFLPKNNLFIPVGTKSINGGLTQASFNKVIDDVSAVMAPIVASHGGKLNVVRNWTSAEVNAFATREGSTWTVQMFGGLARHSEITEDGFRLVMCHEIGHHLGGAPKKSTNLWSSAEGQADYYGVLKCLRFVYAHDNNSEIIKSLTVPAALATSCKNSFSHPEDQAICIRGGMSAASVAALFASLEGSRVSFTTPDTAKVSVLFQEHPVAQCRIDTYFQASICDKDSREEVSNTDENKGVCSTENGDKVGSRPLCWYKPAR